jgi:hypothetical protein
MSDMRSGIENTHYRYAWAYDMNEMDQIGECFTTDAEVLFHDTGLKVGRQAVAAEMARRRGAYADGSASWADAGSIPWHVITNIYITDATDEQATVRAWCTFYVIAPDGTQKWVNVNYYDDVFALEDGDWRVKRRRIMLPQDPR